MTDSPLFRLLPADGNFQDADQPDILWRLFTKVRAVRAMLLDLARRRDFEAAKRYGLAMTALTNAYDDRWQFLQVSLRQSPDGSPQRQTLLNELVRGLGYAIDRNADEDWVRWLGTGQITDPHDGPGPLAGLPEDLSGQG